MKPKLKATASFTIEELHTIASQSEREEKIRVLDVFCGAGGVGWALKDLFSSPRVDGTFAGVDKEDHSGTYPGKFIKMDVADLSLDSLGLSEPVDLVWLSPPCQAYSKLSHIWHDDPKEVHPTFDDLNVRELANSLGKEFVIENVVGCGDLQDPIRLNGPAFNRNFLYERLFETSFDVNSWIGTPTGEEIKFCEVSEKAQAEAKAIPSSWSKTAIRSALPRVYIGYILSHCPTLNDITPEKEAYLELGAGNGQKWLSDYQTPL